MHTMRTQSRSVMVINTNFHFTITDNQEKVRKKPCTEISYSVAKADDNGLVYSLSFGNDIHQRQTCSLLNYQKRCNKRARII